MTDAKPRVLPDDQFNRTLTDNVHPAAWVNPVPSGRYNLVVIGGGSAGLISAIGAAGMGAKVALVEKHLLGGDCLNFGCVPSKAIIRSGRAAQSVRNSEEFGIKAAAVDVDFVAAMTRMRRLRAGISEHDSAKRFKDLGIDVFLGEGHFTSPSEVQVGEHKLQFARAVIATGARARVPSIPGLSDVDYLTNETVFSLTELPRRLVIVGAGPIGCELAQAFARLGSEVTIVGRSQALLPREDPEAGAVVSEQFSREGIRTRLGATITEVANRGGAPGAKIVVCEVDGKSHEIAADEILVSVGRVPNTKDLGLELAKVDHDSAGIAVNDRLRTSNKRIYAAGDVCSEFKFTHAADAMARIVIQNALFFGRKKASSLVIPWCTYTDPEVAHVGLSAREAADSGATTHTVQLSSIDRAILESDTKGFARVHADPKSGRILGATLVASHAGEMIAEMSLAMTAGLGLGTLAKTIHPYPTQSEVWKRLGDEWNRSRFTPRVSRMSRTWLAWIR